MSRAWLSRRVVTGLKVVVSISLLVALGMMLDLRQVGDLLLSVSGWSVVVAAVLFSAQAILSSVRWWWVLRRLGGGQVSIRAAIRLSYIGLFLTTFLPSSAGGDPVRIFMTWRRGIIMRTAILSVLIDRGVGILCLFLLAALAPVLVPDALTAPGGDSLWLMPGLAAVAVLGTAALTVADRLPLRVLGARVGGAITALSVDMRRTFWHGPTALAVMGLGIVGHVGVATATWALAAGIGVELSVFHAVALVPLSILVQIFPVSLGGWGVREAMLVAVLGLVGVPAPEALAISVLSGLIFTASSLPGLVLWLVTPKQDVKAVSVPSDTAASH